MVAALRFSHTEATFLIYPHQRFLSNNIEQYRGADSNPFPMILARAQEVGLLFHLHFALSIILSGRPPPEHRLAPHVVLDEDMLPGKSSFVRATMADIVGSPEPSASPAQIS